MLLALRCLGHAGAMAWYPMWTLRPRTVRLLHDAIWCGYRVAYLFGRPRHLIDAAHTAHLVTRILDRWFKYKPDETDLAVFAVAPNAYDLSPPDMLDASVEAIRETQWIMDLTDDFLRARRPRHFRRLLRRVVRHLRAPHQARYLTHLLQHPCLPPDLQGPVRHALAQATRAEIATSFGPKVKPA